MAEEIKLQDLVKVKKVAQSGGINDLEGVLKSVDSMLGKISSIFQNAVAIKSNPMLQQNLVKQNPTLQQKVNQAQAIVNNPAPISGLKKNEIELKEVSQIPDLNDIDKIYNMIGGVITNLEKDYGEMTIKEFKTLYFSMPEMVKKQITQAVNSSQEIIKV